MKSIMLSFLLIITRCMRLQRHSSILIGNGFIAIDLSRLQPNQQIIKFKTNVKKHFSKHILNDIELSLSNYDDGARQLQLQNYKTEPDYELLKKLNNVCINGKQYDNKVQKLKAFREGPCSPIVIQPGILATSLVAQIDCHQLYSTDEGKRIFEKCGWKDCKNKYNAPAKNYLAWLNDNFLMRGIVDSRYKDCLSYIMPLKYNISDTSTNYKNKFYSPRGIRLTWFGNNNYTKTVSNCGANAISDFSGARSLTNVLASQCGIKGFQRLIKIMRIMGYDSGINFQPLPYDFRYGIVNSDSQVLLPQIIRNLYRLTGKKVILVGHSLGNLHILTGLVYKLSVEEKDKMVRKFVSIAPPFFGSSTAIKNMITGQQNLWVNSMKSGVSAELQTKFTRSSGSVFDIILKDAFTRFRNQPWLQQILKRIEYENQLGNQNQTQYPLSWFPGKDQTCYSRFYKKNPKCAMEFVDLDRTPFFRINGVDFFANHNNISALFNNAFSEQQSKISSSIWAENMITNQTLNNIPSPSVDVDIIFSRLFPTPRYYEYSNYTFQQTAEDFNSPSSTKTLGGDETVEAFSPLLFATKWISEGNNNRSVKMIEYCANYKGPKSNHYSSLSCSCLENRLARPENCVHSCMVNEKNLVYHLIEQFHTRYQNQGVQFNPISQQQLHDIKFNCVNLKIPGS